MRVKVIRSGAREYLVTVVAVVRTGRGSVIIVLVVLLAFFARPTVLFSFPIIIVTVVVIAAIVIVIDRCWLSISVVGGGRVFKTVVIIVKIVRLDGSPLPSGCRFEPTVTAVVPVSTMVVIGRGVFIVL